MNYNIKQLEQFENRFPYYGELLMKILMQKPDNVKFIIKNLLTYLKVNPKVKILSFRNVKEENYPKLKYILTVEFKCSSCKNYSKEETNLICSWIPGKDESNKPICQLCMEKFCDYAEESRAERAYMEKQLEGK